MKVPFFVFTGRAQSGKTTSARFLMNRGFRLISFADPLKRMLQAITLVTDKHSRPPVLCGKSIREAYQTLGTEWGRKQIGEDIWVNCAAESVKNAVNEYYEGFNHGIVIDDCRFDNEAEAMKQLGATIIKIERDQAEVMEHESEKGVSSHLCDFTIMNFKSESALQEAVLDLCGLA